MDILAFNCRDDGSERTLNVAINGGNACFLARAFSNGEHTNSICVILSKEDTDKLRDALNAQVK